MSGTEDNTQIPPGADKENQGAAAQSGTETQNAAINELKTQIAELRKEAASYRVTAKKSASEKQTVEEQLKSLQEEFARTKEENRTVRLQSMLDKAGCVKSELVIKDIPADCEDPKAWIEKYKQENAFLFKQEPPSHGGAYKPQGAKNLTPSQQMDNYIRTALGRG